MAKAEKMDIDEEKSNSELLEETFVKLENVVKDLEKEDISLEKAFDYYRDGVELLKICSEKLDDVEKKVMILNEAGGLDEF